MNQTLYLDGRVAHVTLPVFDPPTGPDAPSLKRLRLPQGDLAQFHDSEIGIRYMAAIELKPGTVRGNHFHLKKAESVYLLSGSAELFFQAKEEGAVQCVVLSTGDLVHIQPGVIHAFRPLIEGVAIEYSPERFDAQDTYRHSLI